LQLWKGIVVTATVGVLATQVTGTAAAGASPFDGYRNQQLAWGPCAFTQDPAKAKTAECALVTVPRDWARPRSGNDVRINISRVRATGERAGVLLVNPGGPGAQGTPVAGQIAALEPAVNEVYDFIGMDPRGTGVAGSTDPASRPYTCVVPPDQLSQRTDLDARDRSPATIAEEQKNPRAIAEACERDPLAPYVTTWQTTYDMELVRMLLGESTLNYLGYSYGTWLGAKYTSMFPASAGKVVLDSSTNWQGRLSDAFSFWPVADQRWLDQLFLPWMVRQWPQLMGTDLAAAKKTFEDVRA
jgi:pimeloyl-ACP methyl ester carboxylesterase